ncbi:MAG: 3,4-dihydroxy-2-butanone-4-phosphate synthase [Luminiphilus sp.]|nr:3,4-dihydroxy-2-butanone-4-phosphate synthase [Pseudomonadales bacterium]MBL6900964.1 3,4-dihydroxy-2-butanone-4-phosphate synthase [Luminiphilus sp.]CAI8363930.1 MAG: Riboflavin biosynthesis protein RibBA [Halieaceae bacterium]
MIDLVPPISADQLISEFRRGEMVLLVLDQSDGEQTGVVAMAAEYCEASHITFMARQARGLVSLALTEERCEQLSLAPMVDPATSGSVKLSIEASTGIDTGISAVDRARTVRVAVASDAKPSDLVQPGHIFPVATLAGGVLIRTGAAEAGVDLATLAGLTPAAAFAEVLDAHGDLADAAALVKFADQHDLKVGRVTDLVDYRLNHSRTVEVIRRGAVPTQHGEFLLRVYRESTQGHIHLALSRGDVQIDTPTLVRVHTAASLRDLVAVTAADRASWSIQESLARIALEGAGVLVLINKEETDSDLLAQVDAALGSNLPDDSHKQGVGYSQVGMGAQILRDLGVGKIRLMGAPVKYNALEGFGLEVVEFIEPEFIKSGEVSKA